MTLIQERPQRFEQPERRLTELVPGPKYKGLLAYLTSTDHTAAFGRNQRAA